MARDIPAQLKDVGLIAGVIAGAYLLWRYVLPKEPTCPAGTHFADQCADVQGLPKVLCEIGRFASGGLGLECVPDAVIPIKPLERDDHGCLLGTQHYCETDKLCRDIAQACTPIEGCPPNTEWSPTHNKCISVGGMIDCPGSNVHTYPELCPGVNPIIPACPMPNECTPGEIVCDNGISRLCVSQGTGCEERGIWAKGGNACKAPSMLVQCSCGTVDLISGITCEQACAPGELESFVAACNAQGGFHQPCNSVKNLDAGFERLGLSYHEGQEGGGISCCWKKTQKSLNEFLTGCRGAGNVVTTNELATTHLTIEQYRKLNPGGEYPGASMLFCRKAI